VLCISPWNFPLAIFTGQIVAALVAGNPVLAKPSHQTPLVAQLCVDLLHRAGIPENVLQLIPASGRLIGEVLLSDARLKGVVMTGSTETAHLIHKTLANRKDEIIPFIAETGGQNAMIVDSSALPEQVIADVLTSAFNSAGQRCSALRVLFLQEEIADKLIALLKGAMQEVTLGDPAFLTTDVGPVIDRFAKEALEKHSQYLREIGKCIAEVPVPKEMTHCNFFTPMAFEIPDLALLKHEVFGPILHVIRYKSKNLDKVIEAINNTHYGLTFGIHSRIHETVEYVYSRIRVGNCYVNRNMIGAVVGVQPFGGIGLSGTGPKAGGPHYLLRLTAERTLSINTAAAGGNTTLMTLTE
jgi:RHH-type proline utilization regulon transcriptional repressor/proline dehydrogenase/delta 1-pyrroline-5-carboxylate dehydrogenase